jgi:catechol 2,3-dioxygenase-like lactoylglutathione lyase family enzyme
MIILDTYPLFTVSHLEQSREFFVRRFGLHVVFAASWVVMLSHTDGGSISVGLMSSDHPSSPPGPETFDGRGMLLTLQVDDAGALHARLVAEGVPIAYPLTDAPWGQRRFMVTDPSGIVVDVVQQIEPASGFWDAYIDA